MFGWVLYTFSEGNFARKKMWELRIQLQLSAILKTSNKSVWNNIFLCKGIWKLKVDSYTIHWDKTQMLNKFLSDKINLRNNALFCELILKFIFLFKKKKAWTLWLLKKKIPFQIKIKIIEKPHTVLLPDLIF